MATYALLFAVQGDRPRLVPEDDLSGPERAERDRLAAELDRLRLAAAGESADATNGRPRSLWHFPDGGPVRIICGRVVTPPKNSKASSHNYTQLSAYADGVDPAVVAPAAAALQRFEVVGLKVSEFPDNSVVCHANRMTTRRRTPRRVARPGRGGTAAGGHHPRLVRRLCTNDPVQHAIGGPPGRPEALQRRPERLTDAVRGLPYDTEDQLKGRRSDRLGQLLADRAFRRRRPDDGVRRGLRHAVWERRAANSASTSSVLYVSPAASEASAS